MKKIITKSKSILVISIVLISFVILSIISRYVLIFPRLYTGDRITGSLKISIDNVPIDIEKCDFTIYDTGDISFNDKTAEISLKGGKHGLYSITVKDGDLAIPINIKVFQYNWHQVTRFDISADIDKKSGICELIIDESSTTDETAVMHKRHRSETAEIKDGAYTIGLGG